MDEYGVTRQERRERKLTAAKERMPKHGASLARVYRDAVLARHAATTGADGAVAPPAEVDRATSRRRAPRRRRRSA